MIQTLLFATDMGVHTHYLLHHVNTLACQYDARVVVIHAIEPPGYLGDAIVNTYLNRDEFPQDTVSQIVAGVRGSLLDMLEDEFMDGQQGLSNISDVRVVAGKPLDVIIEQAADVNCDMIIMGSHGQGTVSANMLGSVTSRILQLSRVPVYMVPLLRTAGLPKAATN